MTIYRMHVKAIMLMIVSYLYLSPDVFGQSARVAKPPKNTGDKLLYKAGDSNFIIGSAQPDTLKGVLFGVVSDTGRSSNKHNFGAFLLPRIDSVHIQRHLATKSVATQGSLLYDSVKKAPRYFDGKTWQTLLSTARQPIYTSNDSLTGDRTVTNRGKKLVFTLDTINTKRSSFSIGQKKPIYPVEIATTSYIKSKTGPNSGADSVALRISHNVMEGKTSYGLLLNERSNKATGRSAIGFMGGNDTTDSLVKARIWAQQGFLLRQSKFGIDVADSGKRLHTRMVIDSVGRVGMGTDKPTERLHIARPLNGGANHNEQRNIIRIDAPSTSGGDAGIWLAEPNNEYGWKIIYNTKNDARVAHAFKNEYTGADAPRSGDFFSIERTTQNYSTIGTGIDSVIRQPDGNKAIPVIRIASTAQANERYTYALNDLQPSNMHRQISVHTPITVIAPSEPYDINTTMLRIHGTAQAKEWKTYSDSMFKRDVRSMVGIRGRDIINGLRPVTYHMRSDTLQQRLNYGFIAQEVERVLPDIVETSPVNIFPDIVDTTMDSIKSMTYDALIAPLVANVQLLNEANAEMESKLSEKEAQINALSEALQQKTNTMQAPQQQIGALQAQQQQIEALQARQQQIGALQARQQQIGALQAQQQQIEALQKRSSNKSKPYKRHSNKSKPYKRSSKHWRGN